MREFGFEDVGEVMDLCCAVRHSSPPPSLPFFSLPFSTSNETLTSPFLISLLPWWVLLTSRIQFMSNSFTLASPSLAPLGVAIHPTAALFNHSCWPNAVVVFPEGGKGGMHIVALRAIEEGEEVRFFFLCFTHGEDDFLLVWH